VTGVNGQTKAIEDKGGPLLERIFYPESVAVIGVSERPDNLAANIIRNMMAFGYHGEIHAVGLRAGHVDDVSILPSVEALPDDVDLAVILTPAATVPELLDACGRKGIRRAVIESGGFTEFSEAGRALEEQVCAVARHWGLRFVGPNCISVVNMENGLCLPFARLDPRAARRGPVSVLAQSGGVSITYLMLLSQAGLGANKVVSMGNKADLDETDYLTYLLDDPATDVICLYLESIQEGRRLLELAAASHKPVIVQKANRGDASAQIAFSHTAALANDDCIVDAALRQAGVARAASFDEAVALAQGFTLPPVTGNDLLIISRSGGHAVVAADVAEEHGFRLMPVPEDFRAEVRGLFRADVIAPTNPLDLGTIFDFDLYSHIVERSLRALHPDALLLVHTYSPGPEAEASRRVAQRLGELSREVDKPLAFCAFAQHAEVEALKKEAPLPVFTQIEGAVRALAASRDRHAHPAKLRPLPRTSARRREQVESLLSGEGVLTTDVALDLCTAFDIPVAAWAAAEDAEHAAVVAAAMGYPVTLKGLASEVPHKSDAGLVALDIADAEELQAAFAEVSAALAQHAPHSQNSRVMVQQMLSAGHEVIIGGKRDPSFGPVVMFGLGGIYVEVLQDVAFRLAPLTRADAEDMIDEVRGSRLLQGVRCQPPADKGAIIEALLSMSRLLVDCPGIVEIDVNPLLVFAEGAAAVDARAVAERQRT
jgi:acetyltransferase